MTAFVIFWAALSAIFFFVAGTLFKALSSAFNALLGSAGTILRILCPSVLAAFALALLYEIIGAIAHGNIGQVIWMTILLVVEGGFAAALLGVPGTFILMVVLTIVTYALTAVSFVLENMAVICERGYIKCLAAVVRRAVKYQEGANG